MKELNLPSFSFKIKTEGAKPQIFDEFRKKWVSLTPEEWVRQHVLQYLFQEKKFPAGLTAVETGIELNGLKRRCDVVYYQSNGKPLMIVECKAPEVQITQTVFDQILRYNLSLEVPYLMVTNGLSHFYAKISEGNKPFFLREIPEFSEM